MISNASPSSSIQVLDLVTEKDEFCELDKKIRQKRREWLSNKEKKNTKNVAEAAKAEMDQLIENRKNAPIPGFTTKVQVKSVTPGFDFSERWGKTPIPANNITVELGIYGVVGDKEDEVLQICLEEMHKMSSCTFRFHGKNDADIKEHIEKCQTLSIFVKAVIPFRTESGKLCFGCYSAVPAGIKMIMLRIMKKKRKTLGTIHYYNYGIKQWLWNESWASPGAHEKPPSPKSRGWRTRYDSSPLSKPLIICLLPGARTRFYNVLNNGLKEGRKTSHPAGHAHELFGKIIAHINEREKEDMIRKHTKLQLAPEQWKSSHNYCFVSLPSSLSYHHIKLIHVGFLT